MVDLFKVLKEQESILVNDKSKKYLKLLSTHPLTGERMSNIQKKMDNVIDLNFNDNEEAKVIFNNLKSD